MCHTPTVLASPAAICLSAPASGLPLPSADKEKRPAARACGGADVVRPYACLLIRPRPSALLAHPAARVRSPCRGTVPLRQSIRWHRTRRYRRRKSEVARQSSMALQRGPRLISSSASSFSGPCCLTNTSSRSVSLGIPTGELARQIFAILAPCPGGPTRLRTKCTIPAPIS